MKVIKGTLILLLLSGCATMLDYQQECEKQFPKFSDMTVCLKQKVAQDSRAQTPANQAYVQRYLLEADKLSELVEQKKMSELDARIRLSDLYLQLKSASENSQQTSIQNYQTQQLINNAAKPMTTSCVGGYGAVNCTTY